MCNNANEFNIKDVKDLKELLGEEFILALRIGLPNYFDYDIETGTIKPKKNKIKEWASNKKVKSFGK